MADSSAAVTSVGSNAKSSAPNVTASAGQAPVTAATTAARPVVVADQDPQKEAEAVIDGAQADDAKQSDGAAKENS